MRKKIKKIIRLLNKAYGKPAPLRRTNPINELIRTVLSQNTSDNNSLRAFDILKKHFKSWDGVLKVNRRAVSHLIKSAGLANITSKRIKDILKEIKKREGRITLARLKELPIEDSLGYLKSLKGVGPKTAACVLLFSFGKPVMPVDTHIFRVTKRLGLIGRDLDIEEAHLYLSGIVPKDLIYDFHLGIIEHGRRTCRARNPRCGICVLYGLCKYRRKIN
jgi:endonuclease-3